MSDAVRIVVLVDATGSMGSYCSSVGQTLKQLFAVLDVLFGGAAAVDIVAYEDYCDGDRVLQVCEASSGRTALRDFAGKLRAGGGGDAPEAVKTALNRVLEIARSHDAAGRTLVIHYTDAPPHHPVLVGSDKTNLSKETKALAGKEPGFDWVKICQSFEQTHTHVITFMANNIASSQTGRFMCMLGDVVCMPDTRPETITKYTMGALLQLMGQPFDHVSRLAFSGPAVDTSSLETEGSSGFASRLKAPTCEVGCFEVHQAFHRDLRQLTVQFQESESFRDMVFVSLKELFLPECVLAITYNSVLGMLWRLVCKRREDIRVQPLCDALSTCCTALSGESQGQLRKWIDESYNQLEEIREIVSAVPDPFCQGVLVLDASSEDDLPTKEDMRSILHSPTPGVLRKVQGLLTRLIVVKSGELPVREYMGEAAPMYVPLALQDKALFSLLGHLLLPGMLTSLRPAAMLAILAHLSGNAMLQPRARAFLASIRGSWIPSIEKAEDYPEILNGEFVRLVARIPEFLTESEAALYKHLANILRVRRAAKLRVPVQVGYTPQLKDLVPDYKSLCKSCGHKRSMTLMVDGTCGLCLSNDQPANSPDWLPDCPEPADGMSHMVECRACNALYAVVNDTCLNVQPKCHYCRNRLPCESVTCIRCLNKLCAPTASDRVKDFECAVCSSEPAKGVSEREIEFAELAERNPGAIRCLGLGEAARKPLFDRLGLFKVWMSHRNDLESVETVRLDSLTVAGKPVLNVVAAFDFITEQVQRGRLAETCSLCFEDRPLAMLQSACGACQNLACQECLRSWYGQLAPGKLYTPSQGLCAFCKRTPKARTLRTFNRLACLLAGRRALQLRADMYYGWCMTCFQITEAVPRECAADLPVLTAFECEACKAKRLLQDEKSLERHSRACPACRTTTVKISGCNHITCPCGAHWCWQCGGQFDESQIYEHMDTEHGTIGLDYDDGDFSEEED